MGMFSKRIEQEVTLSSGAKMPFWAAQTSFARVCSLQQVHPELLQALHDFCLGQLDDDVRDDAITALRLDNLIDSESQINPHLRNVVLAAVHGHGNGLQIVSPFVTAVDQALHNLIDAQVILRSHFPQETADQLIIESISDPLVNLSSTVKHAAKILKRRPAKDDIEPEL